MPIDLNKIIFAPRVSVIAATIILNEGLEDAVTQMGAEESAERIGSPLYELVGRSLIAEGKMAGQGDNLAEFAGRQCYRSWRKGRPNAEYIANVITQGHGSIFEHASVVFQVTGVSRSLTHELIRHRVGTAYSQESQRYVDAKDLQFVLPPLLASHVAGMSNIEMCNDEEFDIFRRSCGRSLGEYRELQGHFEQRLAKLVANGADEKALTSAKKRANEAARSLLPNAAETRLVFTTNLRAMRHILTLRGTEDADLEIRRMVIALLDCAREYAPNFFRDIEKDLGADTLETLRATGTNGRV